MVFDERVIDGFEFYELNKNNFKDGNIDITVWCLTYNHVNHIEDTFLGILSQRRNMNIEIVVIDDASDDGTTDIVKKYADLYPNLFHVYIAKKNVYSIKKNFDINITIAKEMKGKYISCCEGDDLWIDNDKLQIQYDFMEKNTQCSLLIHSAEMLDCRTNKKTIMRPFDEGEVPVEQVIMETDFIIPTSSAMLTKEAFIVPDEFPHGPAGDKRVWLNALSKGTVYYMDRVMSLYRVFRSGSWMENNEIDDINRAVMYMKLADFFLRYAEYDSRFEDLAIKKAKSFCYYIINTYRKKDINEFYRILEGVNDYDGKYISRLWQIQKESLNYILDDEYVGDSLKKFCKDKKVYIYGNGDFGKKMLSRMNNANIKISGIVVSDEHLNNNTSKDCETIPISNLANKKNIGLVVAVNEKFEDEIMSNLERYKINDYITPYWITKDMIYSS